jgi:hypothetical protein
LGEAAERRSPPGQCVRGRCSRRSTFGPHASFSLGSAESSEETLTASGWTVFIRFAVKRLQRCDPVPKLRRMARVLCRLPGRTATASLSASRANGTAAGRPTIGLGSFRRPALQR